MSGAVSLGTLARITSGGTPDRTNPGYWNGSVPWVKTALIQNCEIGIDDIDERITEAGLAKSSAKLIPAGSILMAMVGQGKTRGQVAILRTEAAVSQNCAAIVLKEGTDCGYVYQQLLLHYKAIRNASNSSGQQNLNAQLIGEIRVPLPPLSTQRLVADILFTWDRAIEAAEQLIEAKELSCRALARRLFFAESFPHRRLSEFTRRVTRKNSSGNDHPLSISGTEGLVSQSRYFGKRIAAESAAHYTLLKRGEFAYNKSSSAGYPFGAIKRLDAYDEGIVSTLYLCFALDGDDAPLSDYFAYFCESGTFNHQIYKVAKEGARNHGLLNVAAGDFFAMSMPVPPREHQIKVVEVLGAANRELSLLRCGLAALRTQKRGLMQKLLTGEWRLPLPPAAQAKETP